jgi:hypothetical protein
LLRLSSAVLSYGNSSSLTQGKTWLPPETWLGQGRHGEETLAFLTNCSLISLKSQTHLQASKGGQAMPSIFVNLQSACKAVPDEINQSSQQKVMGKVI